MVEIHDNRHKMSKIQEYLCKIKKIKHIEVAIAILILAVVLIVYAAITSNGVSSKKQNAEASTDILESRLEETLKLIDGAGDVKVMITYNGSVEYVTANTTSQNTNTYTDNGRSESTTSIVTNPIIVNNQGSSETVIVQEIQPDIKGVIVVAAGAGDISVKIELIRAVMVALDVDSTVIEIFEMEN